MDLGSRSLFYDSFYVNFQWFPNKILVFFWCSYRYTPTKSIKLSNFGIVGRLGLRIMDMREILILENSCLTINDPTFMSIKSIFILNADQGKVLR